MVLTRAVVVEINVDGLIVEILARSLSLSISC